MRGNVIYLCTLDDDEYLKLTNYEYSLPVMRRWLQRSLEELPNGQDSTVIERDEDGNITLIWDIDTPYDYEARLFIKEWGPFWEGDAAGGISKALFVMVKKSAIM